MCKQTLTKMHSSRMRTVRCSGRWGEGGGVSQDALGRGVCMLACTEQGVCIPACTGQGCVCPRVSAQGSLPGGGVHPSLREQNDWQTPADGNYIETTESGFNRIGINCCLYFYFLKILTVVRTVGYCWCHGNEGRRSHATGQRRQRQR